ncbi:MAG TPA: hypothetical protein VJ646_16440 [Candidatus Binatia bacterium]|nr:hypothetical protein [Candidatus Binatia bacterium]
MSHGNIKRSAFENLAWSERALDFQEAFRKTYRDPEFHKEYKKFTADDPTPLMPEPHEKTIREIPRDPEVSELFKKLMGAEPLPSRWLHNM